MSERPRLNLKPRNEAAVAKAEEERAKSQKANPFGQAKPRESILANRSGKREEDIMKDELSKDKLRLRLNLEQTAQREAIEADIQELEEAVSLEDSSAKKADLQQEISKKKLELEDLLESFEKLQVAKAKSGEGVRPSERRRMAEEREREQAGIGGINFPGAQLGSRGSYGSNDYSYGSPSAGNSFNTRSNRQGGYNGTASYGSSPGSGQRQGSGRSGYTEPLARNFEGSYGSGQGMGSNDIFANTSEPPVQYSSGSARVQDRY